MMGLSCVTLWIVISLVSMILGMHQDICCIYKNKNHPNFNISEVTLPSLSKNRSLVCIAVLVTIIYTYLLFT